PARIRELRCRGLDLRYDKRRERLAVGQDMLQSFAFRLECLELILDLDTLEPRQLPQADFQNIVGLNGGESERGDEVGLGIVRLANDADHLVDRQQRLLPAFQNMNSVVDFAETVLGASGDGLE